MLPIILLSLLGIGASAFVLDQVFDDDDQGARNPDTEEPDLLTRDGDTLVASEGDDVITDYDVENTEGFDGPDGVVNTLDLLGGNDEYVHDGIFNFGATINGGEGDDTLIISPGIAEGDLNGGAGNDVLTAGLGANIQGGEGDDVINYDAGNGLGDYGGPSIDASDGDDTINVEHQLGWNNSFDTTFVSVTGGDGADEFTIELIDDIGNADDGFDGTLESDGEDEAQVYVQDFNPDEDLLTIDISSLTADGNYVLTDTELTEVDNPHADDTVSVYALTLTLLAEGETDPFEASVLVRSQSSSVTLEDIDIQTGLAA